MESFSATGQDLGVKSETDLSVLTCCKLTALKLPLRHVSVRLLKKAKKTMSKSLWT